MTAVPGGYVAIRHGSGRAIVRADAAEAVHAALAAGTLHAYAAALPGRRALQGRAVAYAIPLGDALRVVVRHNVHGGMLARLTGDRFLAPTRAPRELATALRLSAAGVATPPVVAIVRYPAGGPFERADVATEEVAAAADLAHVLASRARHDAAAHATGALLASLARAGAHHADLNIKNILLQDAGSALRACVLDVDRVVFRDDPAEVAARNWARFERSLRKWRERHDLAVDDAWLASVRTAAGG